MKARLRRFLPLSVVVFASCSSPESALFSDNFSDGPPAAAGSSGATAPVAGSSAQSAAGASQAGSGSHGGASSDGGGNAGTSSAGSSNGGGGGLVLPGTGGSAAGSVASEEPRGGSSSIPDGTAGANDAGGGSIEPAPPVCGNGKLEADEQCDDAGHAGPDGCNSACKVVCSDFGEGAKASSDHHCYKGFDSASFEGAELDCVARGGHLATISSAAENELARSFVKNSKWIGGFEDVGATSEGAGDYEWLTGEPFSFENWDQGEPDRANFFCGGGTVCHEHCVTLLGDGAWIDNRCDLVDGYVCEWDPAGD